MNKFKFYKLGFWILLILNLGLIAFFLLSPPPHQRGKGSHQGSAKKMLHLDEQQNDQFLNLVKKHKEKINLIQQNQADELKKVFKIAMNDSKTKDYKLDSIIQKHERLEGSKIIETIAHFEDVKSILNNDQIPHFETFIHHVIQHITNDKGIKNK